MNRYLIVLIGAALFISPVSAGNKDRKGEAEFGGPTKEVTYQIVLLIESDDQNRKPFDGPARKGLTKAGYDRLVIAGSATAMVSIGEGSSVTGNSRYGQLSITTSMLNTTEENEVQVRIHLQTKSQSPITIDTTARVPLGKWFLVGAADSRVGLPKHTADGKRAVAVMRVDAGVMTLD